MRVPDALSVEVCDICDLKELHFTWELRGAAKDMRRLICLGCKKVWWM